MEDYGEVDKKMTKKVRLMWSELRTEKRKVRWMRMMMKKLRWMRSGFRTNGSPKGNMWSAIPVALLCMVVNWNERKQGSGPEGDEVL